MNTTAENIKQAKWHNKLANFSSAIAKLEQAIAQTKYNDLEKAGLVQTFEFTFELAWKTLQGLLQYQGYINVVSPRDVLKEAYKNELLSNGEIWLDALDNRNLLTHTYDEDTANTAVFLIKEQYFPAMKDLHVKLVALAPSSLSPSDSNPNSNSVSDSNSAYDSL